MRGSDTSRIKITEEEVNLASLQLLDSALKLDPILNSRPPNTFTVQDLMNHWNLKQSATKVRVKSCVDRGLLKRIGRIRNENSFLPIYQVITNQKES